MSDNDDDGPVYFYGTPGVNLGTKKKVGLTYSRIASVKVNEELRTELPKPTQASQKSLDIPICSFFVQGSCAFGEKCRFRHGSASPEAVAYFKSIFESLRESDNVIARQMEDDCNEMKSDDVNESTVMSETEFQQQFCQTALSSDDLLQVAVDNHIAKDLFEADFACFLAEREIGAELTCGICLETIQSVPGRKYGLLPECTHAFCNDCIVQWRSRTDLPKMTVRSCPLCRKIAYFVIPSLNYSGDPARKAHIIRSFQTVMKDIPCRHYDYAAGGNCPFGSSCFYGHFDSNGKRVENESRHTILIGDDGVAFAPKKFTLADALLGSK